MRQVIKETTKYMWRSEKNRLFMVLTTALVVLYTLFVVPGLSSEDEMNIQHLERDMNGNVVQFEQSLKDGLIVPNALTGTTAYNQLRHSYVNQREVLTALKHGDVRRYIATPYRPDTKVTERVGIQQLAFNVLGYELEQPFQQQKNSVYLKQEENLSFHTVHDRTSLQQLHLFIVGYGPILLLAGLIFMISDVHVKDRSLNTQKIGYPLKWEAYNWVQAMTAFGFVLVFYLALGALFYLLNGLQFGFGSLALPVGFYEANFSLGVLSAENFQVRTIGWFLLQATPYLLLLGYLFSRLNTLLSLWTGQSVVTMALGLFTLVFQFIYYGSDSSLLLGFPITNFPQTYFDFGKIITGRFELQIGEAMPMIATHGLLVLGITILVTEVLVFISSRVMTRQKFFN